MIRNEKDIIDFKDCIKDAFYLLHHAVDMVNDQEDHPEIVKIKKIIESKILCYEPIICAKWLKQQVEKTLEILDEYADKEE